MISRILNGGKQHSRLLILIFKHPQEGYCALVHDNRVHFTLDRREHAMTAAFERLRAYFNTMGTCDVHYYGTKQHFHSEGHEYHPVMFDIPMIEEHPGHGISKLEQAGFRFRRLQDHFFYKRISKVIPAIVS